jgi:HPt (histidine-containing phosphotransfer) domain-containing protein
MNIDQERLERLGGMEDGPVKDLVSRFSHSLPERIAVIESAYTSTNEMELRQHLHQLKGSAANFGFTRLCEFCRAAEQGPLSLDLDELKQIAEATAAEWELLR